MVREGKLKIGTKEKPHLNNLTITLHGTLESKTLPGFGNKGIFIQNGQIDIHGKPMDFTWTQLEESVVPGADLITVIDTTNWKVGDQIIIAPTGQYWNETEERTIKAINGKTITLDKALEFRHFAGQVDPNNNHLPPGETETVNTIDPPNRDSPITLRAEVGNLTRNVKIQGNEASDELKHGVQIMLRGEEGTARGRYSFFEITRGGQLFQLGRYPLHYHMIGHVVDNYVEGLAIHNTYNRGTTIHGVDFLHVKNNVYYNITGHCIFLEDGIEANNVIEKNLVVYVKVSTSMLLSDLDPSGLWQSRPSNYIRDNHFVASEGNGSWFQLVGNPTGPSATNSICPDFETIVQYDRNVHHSNLTGFKIYPTMAPKVDPCKEIFNYNLRDPFSDNPDVIAKFYDNVMYMNGKGSHGKIIGAIQYHQHKWISNSINQKIFRPHLSKDSNWRSVDSISIGVSELTKFHVDAIGNSLYNTSKAFQMPQTHGFFLKDVRFYNFDNGRMFELCTMCEIDGKRFFGGVQFTYEAVQFKNIKSKTLFEFRDAVYDKDLMKDNDGSLMKVMGVPAGRETQFANGGWVTTWFPHLDIPECFKQDDEKYCSYPCAVCSSEVNLRRVKHTPIDDITLLDGQDLKVFNLGKVGDDSNPNGFNTNMNGESVSRRVLSTSNPDDDKFGFSKFRNLEKSYDWKGWLTIVATSYQYNFHIGNGVEWVEMKTENDYYWGLDGVEQPVLLRHNFTEPRETYEGTYTGAGALANDVYGELTHTTLLKDDVASLEKFGDYTVDLANKFITWKVDEKRIGGVSNKSIYCTGDNCTVVPDSSEAIENDTRNWSDAASWSNGTKPTTEDLEVVIEETWNMVLDENIENLKQLKIKGRLTFSPTTDNLLLSAYLIEIFPGGELIIGSSETPHNLNATIQLLGEKSSDYLTVTSDIAAVNKAIVNKGFLHLYGLPPAVKWTRLAGKIAKDSNSMKLVGNNLGWKVGDEIIVASSSTKAEE